MIRAYRGSQSKEGLGVFGEDFPDKWRCCESNDSGKLIYLTERGVEVDELINIGDPSLRESSPDRASPVVHYKRKSRDSELFKQLVEVVNTVLRAKDMPRSPLRETTPNMVRDDQSKRIA
jgi:hypothetical protein